MRFLICLLSVLLSLNSYAADERGNGGDVVACYDDNDKLISAKLLDFYEAEDVWEVDLDLGGDDLTVMEKVELIISRIRRFDEVRADRYTDHLEEFFDDDITRWTDGYLPDIPDSKHIDIPYGCVVEQIAVQIEPEFPEERRYTISNRLWNEIDKDNQAGLVLHEIIYREALELEHTHSRYTRRINWKLASTWFKDSANLEEYLKLLSLSSIGPYVIATVNISPNTRFTKFYDSGELAEARLWLDYQPNFVDVGGKRLPLGDCTARQDPRRPRPPIPERQQVKFHDTGEFKGGFHFNCNLHEKIEYDLGRYYLNARFFETHKNGSISKIYEFSDHVWLHGHVFYSHDSITADFHDNKVPKFLHDCGTNAEPIRIIVGGEWKELVGYFAIDFDRKGHAINWEKVPTQYCKDIGG